ncbi:hypothetical protein VPH35_086908 [Triticum aestivum]
MAADCPRRHPSDQRRISLAAAPPRAIVLRFLQPPRSLRRRRETSSFRRRAGGPAALDLIVAARISKPALRQVILSPGMDSPTPDLTPPVVPVAGAFNNAPSPAMNARPRASASELLYHWIRTGSAWSTPSSEPRASTPWIRAEPRHPRRSSASRRRSLNSLCRRCSASI